MLAQNGVLIGTLGGTWPLVAPALKGHSRTLAHNGVLFLDQTPGGPTARAGPPNGVHNGAYGFAAPTSPVTIPSPPKIAASLPVCSMRLPLPPPIQLHPPSAAFSAPPLTDDA